MIEIRLAVPRQMDDHRVGREIAKPLCAPVQQTRRAADGVRAGQ